MSQNNEKYADLIKEDGVFAVLDTEKGNIIIKMFYKRTPLTVANFVGLAEGKITNSAKPPFEPYYDGLTFHRVVPNFVIQGGCPLGTGTGDPGYKFADEFHPDLKHNKAGILSMANSGPASNGSQFFITHTATPHLDGKHSVFGEVVEGMDVVNDIRQGDMINKVVIIRNGSDAEAFQPDDDEFEDLQEEAEERAYALLKEKAKSQMQEINDKFPGLEKTATGLMFKVLKDGDGKDSPKAGKQISCHYSGTLLDGTEFDSSYKRGTPISFKIGQVIEGWNEALQTMTKGEKRLLVIPPELGYGASGAAGVIPPNAYLVFEVELLDF